MNEAKTDLWKTTEEEMQMKLGDTLRSFSSCMYYYFAAVVPQQQDIFSTKQMHHQIS